MMDPLVSNLTRWFRKNARRLPWRLTQDPYRIWISEVMLQQTQVATVIPYYDRFLAKFPTLQSLAEAKEEQVLSLWAGLGYYSRARNLHRGAQYLVEKKGGIFPKTGSEILEVPGIGPYTAGAILSIAFDLPEALVDGNVQRVFSRYFAYQHPIDMPKAQKFFWAEAKRLVSTSQHPRLFNQALMELGARVCTKASPDCARCPIQSSCEGFRLQIQNEIPFKAKKTKYKDLFWITPVFEKEGKYLVRQNVKGEWWTGLWDFPREEIKSKGAIQKKIQNLIGKLRPESVLELSHQKHTVTHHRIYVVPIHLKMKKAPPFKGKWVTPQGLTKLPTSALVKKILSEMVS